jgi:hypothetical protein
MGESVLNPERESRHGRYARGYRPPCSPMPGSTPREPPAFWADVGLSEVAEQCGTPTYVYNAAVIRRQYKLWTGAAELPTGSASR